MSQGETIMPAWEKTALTKWRKEKHPMKHECIDFTERTDKEDLQTFSRNAGCLTRLADKGELLEGVSEGWRQSDHL